MKKLHINKISCILTSNISFLQVLLLQLQKLTDQKKRIEKNKQYKTLR